MSDEPAEPGEPGRPSGRGQWPPYVAQPAIRLGRPAAVAAAAVLVVVIAVVAARGPGPTSVVAASTTSPAPADPPAPTSVSAPVSASALTTTPPPADLFDTGAVTPRDHDEGLWLSWSLVDRAGHRQTGSANRSTERTNAESSMKVWIATDLVRVAGERGRALRAKEKADIDAALRRSDDGSAERLYRSLGADQVLRDLQTVCGVGVSTTQRGYWAYAQFTAVDATTIFDCVLDKAPTYPGGDRIVTALHDVAPDNAFGIPEALPAGTSVAVKNGWTAHSATGLWNVNCVASWGDYTLAVLTRYPISRGLDYGADACRDVTASLLPRLR